MPKVGSFIIFERYADVLRLVQDKQRCTQICIRLSATDSTRLGSDPRALPLWGVTRLISSFYQHTHITLKAISRVVCGATSLSSDHTSEIYMTNKHDTLTPGATPPGGIRLPSSIYSSYLISLRAIYTLHLVHLPCLLDAFPSSSSLYFSTLHTLVILTSLYPGATRSYSILESSDSRGTIGKYIAQIYCTDSA
jgi:hypothetical protein